MAEIVIAHIIISDNDLFYAHPKFCDDGRNVE